MTVRFHRKFWTPARRLSVRDAEIAGHLSLKATKGPEPLA